MVKDNMPVFVTLFYVVSIFLYQFLLQLEHCICFESAYKILQSATGYCDCLLSFYSLFSFCQQRQRLRLFQFSFNFSASACPVYDSFTWIKSSGSPS